MSEQEERWLADNGWKLDAKSGKWINSRTWNTGNGWSTGAYYSFSCALQSQLWESRHELINAWNEAQWTRIEPGCKMPADGERVLVSDNGCVHQMFYDAYTGHFHTNWSYSIVGSHWRPVPAAPKDGDV